MDHRLQSLHVARMPIRLRQSFWQMAAGNTPSPIGTMMPTASPLCANDPHTGRRHGDHPHPGEAHGLRVGLWMWGRRLWDNH